LARPADHDDDLFMCPVVFYELWRGLSYRGADRQLEELTAFARTLQWIDYDRAMWVEAAGLWADPRRHGRTHDDADLLIAAFARRLRATLVTNNTADFKQHRLIVNTPKSGKLRTIDVPAALTATLRELHSIRQAQAVVEGAAMSPWIFRSATDPNRPMNDAWFRDRVWRPLLEKAEVRPIRVHDARHTYASLMLRRGVPIAYVSNQLGHSSIQITVDLYGHFIPGADRHHVEGLAEAIEEAERQLDATQPQPDPACKKLTSS
jgi:integrase